MHAYECGVRGVRVLILLSFQGFLLSSFQGFLLSFKGSSSQHNNYNNNNNMFSRKSISLARTILPCYKNLFTARLYDTDAVSIDEINIVLD